jgi:methyl-accepting chemotaxis protein
MRGPWTVGLKLYAAVGALGALLVVSGGTSWWATRAMDAELERATGETATKLELTLKLDANSRGLRSEQRRALLSGFANDPATVSAAGERISVIGKTFEADLASLSGLLVSAEGRRVNAAIVTSLADWQRADQRVQELLRAGKPREAWEIAREVANPLIDGIDKQTDTLLEQQHAFMTESKAAGDALISTTQTLMIGILLLTVAIVPLAFYVVRGITAILKDASTELRSGSQQVVAASTQLAAAAQSLSQGATEQSASLEETSASMEEMASMTRKNAEHSSQAATLMNEADRQVADSNQKLESMVGAMLSIRESSQKVSKIIKTIDEIAFQTNILALNAAVEAARAGEAGMGFAVVADEVRNLAQRSAQAAKDTSALIEESITKSVEGQTKVEQVAASIAGITESVTRVKGLVDEVSSASREQSQGIDQVAQAIAQMEKVTQTTAATAEESAAASEELNAQAVASVAVVAKLEAMVGGSAQRDYGLPSAPAKPSRAARVIRMAGKTVARPAAAPQDDPLPMDDTGTGTYGKF